MIPESIEFTKRQIKFFFDDLVFREEETSTLNYIYGIVEKLIVFICMSTIILGGIYKLWIYSEAYRYFKIAGKEHVSVNPVIELYKFFWDEYTIQTLILSFCFLVVFVGALFFIARASIVIRKQIGKYKLFAFYGLYIALTKTFSGIFNSDYNNIIGYIKFMLLSFIGK